MSKPTRPRQGPSSTSGTLRGLGRALAARLRRGKAPPEPLLPDLHLMVVDASVGAYGRWRDDCAAVSDAYVSWRSAAPSEAA
ncbi:MAG: hypothetical protein QOJ07_3696, partial [Thermoleophilaceae bacterium]|nr:hypothetical protein [Thermoleophilaceae bacterium]